MLQSLGSVISANGSSEVDIEQQIGAAMRVGGVMERRELKRRQNCKTKALLNDNN